MKNQKGITLVALVITIIVLLILAGVSISLVLGQNGVLTQASGSVIKDNVAKVKEDLSMALAASETKYYTAWASDSSTTRSDIYEGATKNPVDNTDGAFIDELSGKYYVSTAVIDNATADNATVNPLSANSVAKNSLVEPTANKYVQITLTNITTNETYVFDLLNGVDEDSGSYTISSKVHYKATNQTLEFVNV